MMKDEEKKNQIADEDIAKTEPTMKKSCTSTNNLIHHSAADGAGVTHFYHTHTYTH